MRARARRRRRPRGRSWAAGKSTARFGEPFAKVTGVIVFRVCDHLKAWPANVFETRLRGGWGVVMDDIAAGVWGAMAILAMRGLAAV
ncbi:MAG: phosphatidylglycerophosphatase A [Polyangiaceae bacterium]